ncbi:MAG TPA: NAD-dependent epimerase/dehydratase family protein, partial [Acidimicrobiales bacterium]|nr:NAD-dependent epimerase/dehydratase family protein [Acidimicrobiales bacterium]
MKNVLVTGGGGFIGGHLVARLREQGVDQVRAVDQVPLEQWHQSFPDVDNQVADLQELASCRTACEGVDT